MANKWTLPYKANAFDFITGSAVPGVVPTTNRPCANLDDTTDTSFIISGILPDEYAGGTIKLDLYACANTTTAADDAQIDVVTEFRTPGAGEALNTDNFDATADSGTFTFSTTAYSLRKITITLTPVTTPVKGDLFRIKITRDANHATLDSLTGDLKMVRVLFYEVAA